VSGLIEALKRSDYPQELTREIDENAEGFHFITPEGFAHYLPFFLLCLLNHPESLLADIVISISEYKLVPEWTHKVKETSKLLDAEDLNEWIAVLRECFERMEDDEPWHYVDETVRMWGNNESA
jgi:hypothetical protein